MNYDFCVIGGGIVGLATAMKLLEKRPGASLVVLEKENGLGRHQTGHNSGVIHAGIYYAPGSFKAELCRRGAQATKEFCTLHSIPFEVCGKMLVATNEVEARRMEALYRRSVENNVEVEKLDSAELKLREPNITGVGALFVPSTGIVNYRLVCEAMGRVITDAGGQIEYGVEVDRIQETEASVTIGAGERTWTARRLVACAGLQSDRVARTAGLRIEHQIVPFRGEYYRLPDNKSGIVKSLIYPIPDPELPFLGIHLTRMIDGGVTVGPNAVLGFAREGYPKFSFSLKDVLAYLTFPGFWKVILKNRNSAVTEMKNSFWKAGYLKECQKYCPSLRMSDLLPYEAGIRAQAVKSDGTLVHDFLFEETSRTLHVCNAPSPAATAAIPIGEMIATKVMGASDRAAA
jgi:(S)-2-hydroxyglutarate dehydrogenase